MSRKLSAESVLNRGGRKIKFTLYSSRPIKTGTKFGFNICWTTYRDSLSRSPNNIDNLKGGTEWRYLDNTKHYIFWLCDMKQLTGLLTLTVKNSLKTRSKKANIMLFSISRRFRPFIDNSGLFQRISEGYRRFRKTNEEVRPLPKVSDEPSTNT